MGGADNTRATRKYFNGPAPLNSYFLENRGDGMRVYRACPNAIDEGDQKREGLREVYLVPDKKDRTKIIGTFEPLINESDEGSSMTARMQHIRGGGDANLYIGKGFRYATSEKEIRAVIEAGAANKKQNLENRRLRNPSENLKETVKGIGEQLAGALVSAQQGKRPQHQGGA